MCGIFAVLNDKNKAAGKTVFESLKNLEYRGYDSWGMVIKKKDGQYQLIKKTGKINPDEKINIEGISGIGHTRWATHGGVTIDNAHPHFDCQKEIFIVHNGIIENFQAIKENLIRKNHRFSSQTDSEVVAHLVEEITKKTQDKLKIGKQILKTFSQLKGLNAFVIYIPKNDLFYAIKNSSPLVFGYDDKNKQYFLASDYSVVADKTENIYYLEDNELLILSCEGYLLINKEGKKKEIKFLKIKLKKDAVTPGKFPHYMIKEIYEQPAVLENILINEKKNTEKLAKIIKKSYGNYFIGCGSAYYACLAGTYFFSKIAKRHTNACVASEFNYLVDFLTPKSLVIALSQSGETIDVISSVKRIKEKKSQVFAITNVLGSTLYRMADYKMLLNAGPEKCVLATKSFTAKLAIIYLLSYKLNGNYQKAEDDLKKAIQAVKKILKMKNEIAKLAKFLKNKNHIFILGRGLSYPLALESALKIKEVSYIHAEGFAAGELKHGVIALIDKGTPVIVYNPEDETYSDTLSSAFEVLARGAFVIGISNKNSNAFNHFIKIDNCGEATIIPNVVFAQLLGYYLAVEKGLDPDKPRNLAKSVTVK
ncbi:MAG: glutamine--fructose-6-phosphate transaminase (isomerizing) [Microgenomates group bacterium]